VGPRGRRPPPSYLEGVVAPLSRTHNKDNATRAGVGPHVVGDFNNCGGFEDFGDDGKINGDVGSGLQNARVRRGNLPMLSESDTSGLDTGSSDDDHDEEGIGDRNGVKFMYQDSTWNQKYFTYELKPMEFSGVSIPNVFWYHFPTFLQLFELFWLYSLYQRIVHETNRYAMERENEGTTRDGPQWEEFAVSEFKAYVAIWLYMGMRRQPNIKSYWMKEGSIFHCPSVSNVMTRKQFMALNKCLHITNPTEYVREKRLPGYDKLGQVRWLVNVIRDSCKRMWKLGKFCMIDEMMIRYKGIYCPLRQYMPQKPQKWDIKVWCLAYSVTKFVWNFIIYCGKDEAISTVEPITRGEPKLAHKVVMELSRNIEGKGHVIAIDNFFTNIDLFKELTEKAIYATGTLRSNRIGISSALKNTKVFSRMPQRTLDWWMHESRSMSSVL
jgi:hypothetical protein